MPRENRRGAPWRLALAAVLLILHARPAPVLAREAAEIGAVAVDHPGFVRIVFDTDAREGDRVSRDGDEVTVILGSASGVPVVLPEAPGRNVTAATGGQGRAVIRVVPGAAIRWTRVGGKAALDIVDPPRPRAGPLPLPPIPPAEAPARPAETAAVPEPKPAPVEAPEPAIAGVDMPKVFPLPAMAAASPVAPPASPAVAPAVAPPVVAAEAPVAVPVAAVPAGVPVAAAPELPAIAAPLGPPMTVPGLGIRAVRGPGPEPGFILPFEAGVGAAAFRRPGAAFVVFDHRRPFDLAPLREDPALAGATVQMLPAATLLSLPLDAGQAIGIARVATGWSITVLPAAAPAPEAIRLVPEPGRLGLRAADAAGVVTLADPDSGVPLLVGTLRRAGHGMVGARQLPGFALPVTWLGVVVEPLSDALALRAVADGFVLQGGEDGLALAAPVEEAERAAAVATRSRRFDFPNEPVPALLRRLQGQAAAVAATPPLARGPRRRDLAQTMLALGLGAEAQTVLQVTARDDPREAENLETTALAAVAALLAGRPGEAGGLDDPGLNGSDEIALWRAIRAGMRGDPTASLAALSANAGLLMTYPAPLRERTLPLAAEALLLGGEVEAARPLLALAPAAPALAYARALALQAAGEEQKALAAYDAVAAGPDRLQRAKAARRAAELRLEMGLLTQAQAADALERLLFAWRGDALDLALRLRVADLRAGTGGWRPALALLRETAEQFPDDAPAIAARLRDTFAALLRGDGVQGMPALDLVALVDENMDLMPEGAAAAEIVNRLVDRLLALDLPRRAEPLLRKLAAAAPPGPARAGFGASLARLLLQEGNPRGALEALAGSAAEDVPAPVAQDRAILAARATARAGDYAGAIGLLANLDSDSALHARAAIQEDARDWPHAAETLAALLGRTLPAEGALNDGQQRALLRLATLATQAGDAGLLARLRAAQEARMPPGPVGDLFRLLTAESAQSVADLPRTARELALARAISAEPGRR